MVGSRKRMMRVPGLRRLVITPTNCEDGAIGSSEELKGGLVVSVFDKQSGGERRRDAADAGWPTEIIHFSSFPIESETAIMRRVKTCT
jgi:hypothetical protein